MHRKITAALIATLLLVAFVALPRYAAASSGCCMEANVYFDSYFVNNSPPVSICLYGWNQNWTPTGVCQNNVYPITGQKFRFPGYWWQSGITPAGYGGVDVITYYADGSNYWINAVVPYQSNCYGAYYFLVFSWEGITSC